LNRRQYGDREGRLRFLLLAWKADVDAPTAHTYSIFVACPFLGRAARKLFQAELPRDRGYPGFCG